MTPEAQVQAPDSLMLYGFWYRAMASGALTRNGLQKAMLLETPLVIGRDRQGKPFALRDACPHRGMPLSCGRFDGQQLECSYHGWKFDAHSGQCQLIPSLTSDQELKVDRIYAGSYPCAENDGYVWVFIPEPLAAGAGFTRAAQASSAVPRVRSFGGKYKIANLTADLPCSVDHGIIGLMDPAHGPFVHQAWWWRSRHSIHEKQKHFEPIPNGFRMSAHAPSSNSAPYKLMRMAGVNAKPGDQVATTIDFVLPNLRVESVRYGEGWFSTLTSVTPITATHCRIDVRAAWNIFRWATPLVLPIGRYFGKKFIRQDQLTMEQQAEGLKHNPNLMLIDDADRPAKWYFALKQALLDARRAGEPIKHPMSEPVVLKWRS